MQNVKALGRLKRRIGANGPGVTVAVIALVFALVGGAYAASGALTGKQKKEVEKIAKKFAGKEGAKGATGATGPQGVPGPKGDAGAAGKDGASVKVAPVSAGDPEHCAELGGALVEKEGSGAPAEVCNGEEGEEGSPWTAKGRLPQGAMLTGTWVANGSGIVNTSLSFPIHLEEPETGAPIPNAKIFYGSGTEEPEIEVSPGKFEKTEFQKHCANAASKPEVISPNTNTRTLCIYNFPAASTEATFEYFSRTGTELAQGGAAAGGFLALNITTPGTVYGSYVVSGG